MYNIQFQSPDRMPKWDHQNTSIIFAAIGIGLLFVTLLASRNSFQLTRTSTVTNYQEGLSDLFI